MEANKTELCESLLIWLQTFRTTTSCKTIPDLTNGVTMAQVLHQIDPSWFNDPWLSRIKEDVADNWRLKLNNLKKILQSVLDYYQEVLDQDISVLPHPDLNRAAEYADPVELGRLLQLILGCAVNCEDKQEHIQTIMTLEESVQHVVMTAIQELMHKEPLASPGVEPPGDCEQQLKRITEELREALAAKEELVQRCQELDIQVTSLQEERSNLLMEFDVLTARLNEFDSFDDPNSVVGKKYSHLQLRIEKMQEENFRLEAAKEDYRNHCEELEKQVIELQHRNDDLTGLAEQARALKDELDVLRNASDKVEQLEGRVETYRKKLENMNDLRRQVKSLEEKNTVYMQNAVSLEEELRKANAARGQLEAYKIQVQELHNTLSEETRRGDQLEFEVKHLKEKYEAVEKEKERIITERDTLKETNEELKCAQLEQGHLLQAGSFPPRSPSHDNLAAEILPVDHKEKLIRLQHENKMLRLQLEGSENERIKELQGQLAEALRKVNKEETESRLYKQRSLELQQQVDELQKILNETGSTAEESSLLKQKLELEIEKLHNANGNLREKEGLVEDLQQELHLNSQKIEELQAALRKKDDDMKAMEDRYKMYLEKARNVIKTLDPKCNPATAEYQALKKKLGEKDARIQTLEKECEQAKLREYEENLIVTAWYNKSLAFQRAAIESRLGRKNPNAIPSTQSFLTQQRQVTNSGRSLSVAIPATASK